MPGKAGDNAASKTSATPATTTTQNGFHASTPSSTTATNSASNPHGSCVLKSGYMKKLKVSDSATSGRIRAPRVPGVSAPRPRVVRVAVSYSMELVLSVACLLGRRAVFYTDVEVETVRKRRLYILAGRLPVLCLCLRASCASLHLSLCITFT